MSDSTILLHPLCLSPHVGQSTLICKRSAALFIRYKSSIKRNITTKNFFAEYMCYTCRHSFYIPVLKNSQFGTRLYCNYQLELSVDVALPTFYTESRYNKFLLPELCSVLGTRNSFPPNFTLQPGRSNSPRQPVSKPAKLHLAEKCFGMRENKTYAQSANLA